MHYFIRKNVTKNYHVKGFFRIADVISKAPRLVRVNDSERERLA